MRIMLLDRIDPTRVPTKVVVELVKQADGSVRATWHDDVFRHQIVDLKPAVLGDDGKFVELTTPELLYRYAAKLYWRSQVYAVVSP